MARDKDVMGAQVKAAAQAVLVSTGDVNASYVPVNIVFAVGGSAGGIFKAASAQEAFEGAKYQLQLSALQLGGNAVVHCRFGYETTAAANGCGSSTFTVTGYGTVVRFS